MRSGIKNVFTVAKVIKTSLQSLPDCSSNYCPPLCLLMKRWVSLGWYFVLIIQSLITCGRSPVGVFHGHYDHKSFTNLYEGKLGFVMFMQVFALFLEKNFRIIYHFKIKKKPNRPLLLSSSCSSVKKKKSVNKTQ